MRLNHFLLFAILLSGVSTFHAQIPNGSIAPNFISTDLEGNEWELYQVLDQGKTVILDISATWCAPCWDYHTAGHLDDLYALYGPDGTDEFMIFLVEGDASTTTDDLYGTGPATLGNWVTDTHYPILDDRDIAEAFQINFFPTLFMICPNRRVYQMGQLTSDQIYQEAAICPAPVGLNNASILSYEGFEGDICQDLFFPPAILLQNMGTAPLTSATINLILDGLPEQSIQWAGNLSTYQTTLVAFDSILVNGDLNMAIEVSETNGLGDDSPGDNTYLSSIQVAPSTDQSTIQLALQLDNSPWEIYWELVDANGQVLFYHGNRSVKYPTSTNIDQYQTANALVEYELALPTDGCYELQLYDSFGDGLAGNGSVKITLPDGSTLVEGGNFNSEEFIPFGIDNSNGTLLNGTLLSMAPLPDDFCFNHTFEPEVLFQNVGSQEITSVEIEIQGNNDLYLNHIWTGVVAPGKAQWLTLPAITLSKTDDVQVNIVALNGEAHTFGFRNNTIRSSLRRSTTANAWTIDFVTGSNAHEIYWQITNDNQDTLLSGGNQLVALNGGGLGIATPADPGAYAENSQLLENLQLTAGECYHLQILDDGGNGLSLGGFGQPNPFFRIRNNEVGIIVNASGNYGESYEANIEIESSNTVSTLLASPLRISPNPATDFVSISMKENQAKEMACAVIQMSTGQIVAQDNYPVWNNQVDIQYSLHDFPAGMYLVKMNNGTTIYSSKFIVASY